MDQMMVKIARPLVVAKLKEAEKYEAEYKPLSAKERDDFVGSILDKNPAWAEVIRKQAKKALERPATDGLELDL